MKRGIIMTKLKKIISILLLCNIVLVQHIYAAENFVTSESQSTNKNNIENGGYFAEKNHILYYFKTIGTDKNNCLLQLYQYNFQTKTETLLCEDFFEDIFAISYNIRVCNDGYVYFYGKKTDDDREGYYRVSIKGGKSEYYGSSTKITFLSDNWIYDKERNVLCNLTTQKTIENTIQDLYRITGHYVSFLEYQDILYIHIQLPFSLQNDEKQDVNCINGEQLENGLYAVSLYKQNDFYKMDIDIPLICAYNNALYYEDKNQIKAYSLQNHTTKIVVPEKEGSLSILNAYNDILYYRYTIEKNGKTYKNIYGISLKEGENQPFLAVPYLFGYCTHILEDVVCYANVQKFYTGNWRIFDIHTAKRYFINPY